MKKHFEGLAAYNRWANDRLYTDAAALPEHALDADAGVYFTSLRTTLVHILNTDRAWIYVLSGGPLSEMRLPAVQTDFAAMRAERAAEDDRLIAWIGGQDAPWFAQPFAFTSALGQWKGMTSRGTRADILTHVFNHQAHHRGQAHAALTRLGIAEPLALDVLVKGFLDGAGSG